MAFVFHKEDFDKKISKNWSSKYNKNLLNHVKQSAADAFKTASK